MGGEVVEVGQSVKDYSPGNRVFVAPKVPCMTCYYCRHGHYPVCSRVKERMPGGFSEYVLVPETLVKTGTYLLPHHITFDQSTFIEPLACAVRAQRLAGIGKDQTLLVLGCGMSGLLHVKLAAVKGCRIVATDIDEKKLQFAEKFGAHVTINGNDDVPERLMAENKRKADVVLLCTPAFSAVDQAWQSVDKGGVVVFFAVPGPDKKVTVPINDYWQKEITIRTSYYCGPPDIVEAIGLLETGKIEVEDMITHRLPLKDVARGFELVMDGKKSIKVIIKPHE